MGGTGFPHARIIQRVTDKETTQNITMADSQRTRSKIIGGILLVVFCFFYIIPLVAVSALSNLGAL